MIKRLILSLLMSLLLTATAQAALSDAQAVALARKTWGNAAQVSKIRVFGDSNWTFQVGFNSPGCAQSFTVLGSALDSWDQAFANVAAVVQTYAGVRTMVVSADANGVAPGAIQSFKAFVSNFQFVLDGKPLGSKMLTPATLPWSMSTPWDTSLTPDGFHVLCGVWGDTAGNTAPTNATMLVVKNH